MPNELRAGPPATTEELIERAQTPVPYEPPRPAGIFLSAERFDIAQRSAKALSHSPMVPKQYRAIGQTAEEATANCLIALNIADLLGEDPLTIMQNLHVINGRPAWSAEFMVARANASGKLREEIDYEVTGEGDNLTVVAKAVRINGKPMRGTKVTMAMARKEGWTKNSKYQSMPEQMLKWRAAAFLVRQHCPEVLGPVRYSVDEVASMRVVGESRVADRPPAREVNETLRRQALAHAKPVAKPKQQKVQALAKNEARDAIEGVTLRDMAAPEKPLFPEPDDDFNSGQFTADMMAWLKAVRTQGALDALLERHGDSLEKLRQRAPKSFKVVEDVICKRRGQIA